MSECRDIVIAGGGMVGVSLALQLGHELPQSTRICLVEGFPLPQPVASGVPDYHPAFDARSTALSYSTRLVYQQIGVWDALRQWLCPIESIHVSSRGHFGSTLLHPDEHGWDALGYVVENAWLGNTLIQALHRQARVELISPARVVAARPGADAVQLTLEGGDTSNLETSLLVVADGAASGLRQQLGMAVEEKPYRQCALIANIATARAHQGCAFERFTDEGPVAMLPLLPSAGAEHRSALVWTLSPERANTLQACDEEAFLAELQQRFGYRLGRLLQVGERHSYPLSLVTTREQVRRGVVVMGNAAHALHPVAGQGYNLALRDIAELGAVLRRAASDGDSPGDLRVLQSYRDRQAGDQQRTIAFSDRLPELFMRSDPVLGLARDMALSGLDLLPALKREFVRQAAGVAAMEESGHG